MECCGKSSKGRTTFVRRRALGEETVIQTLMKLARLRLMLRASSGISMWRMVMCGMIDSVKDWSAWWKLSGKRWVRGIWTDRFNWQEWKKNKKRKCKLFALLSVSNKCHFCWLSVTLNSGNENNMQTNESQSYHTRFLSQRCQNSLNKCESTFMRLPSCKYWAMDLAIVSKKNQEYCGFEFNRNDAGKH